MRRTIALAVLVLFFASACVSVPRAASPSAPALLGSGKTPNDFARDDSVCRQQAQARAGSPAQAAEESQAGSAILGTILGAALGAAIGAVSGSPGLGAAIGAGAGLAGGAVTGASAASVSAAEVQRRFDAEYFQCMYAMGHQIPGAPAPVQYQQPAARTMPPPPPPPPSPGPSLGTQPGGPPSSPSGMNCRGSGKYVRTPQGLVEICE